MMDDVTFLASLTEDSVVAWVSRYFYLCIFGPIQLLSGLQPVPQACCVYLHWDLCSSLCLPLPPSLTVPACLSVSLCLSLSPWPVWSVIEGAVFTWPTGMEGTLCALWRQIALLAPRSLYLSFTSLLLPSSNHAHTLTTLLVSPLYQHSPLPSHPSSLSY